MVFRIFLLSLFIFSVSFNCSFSMERNWQWVESDDEIGYFIDVDNAYNHKSIGQLVDYSDVWVKCAYTMAGAESEIDMYGLDNIDSNVLKEGYGLHKLRLKYLTGEIQYLYTGFYDHNGNLLANCTDQESDTNIYRSSYLDSIMYFMSSKITKRNEFSIYQNSNISKSYYQSMKNEYDGVTRFYVPIYSIKNFGDKYEFVFNRVDYDKDKKITSDNVYYIRYEGDEYYYIIKAEVQRGYKHYMIDLDEPEKNEIVPSSYLENAIAFVKDFCEDNNNSYFIHRLGPKGLIPQ